jgi:hypothetical protein
MIWLPLSSSSSLLLSISFVTLPKVAKQFSFLQLLSPDQFFSIVRQL